MKLLLDTSIFLWYISDYTKLPKKMKDAIMDSNNDVYLSTASVWEIVIKKSIQKIELPDNLVSFIEEQRILHKINSLPVKEQDLVHIESMPYLHKDTFDRLLISQSIANNLTFMTRDKIIKKYCKVFDFYIF
ncbi:MAG: hypothetical protein HW421_3201 [Ignavibacteria bacterium]|nr:hypothetical protein [Ignavibacteria bacterium]